MRDAPEDAPGSRTSPSTSSGRTCGRGPQVEEVADVARRGRCTSCGCGTIERGPQKIAAFVLARASDSSAVRRCTAEVAEGHDRRDAVQDAGDLRPAQERHQLRGPGRRGELERQAGRGEQQEADDDRDVERDLRVLKRRTYGPAAARAPPGTRRAACRRARAAATAGRAGRRTRTRRAAARSCSSQTQ